jgi:YegS/Rv2252/BmrU family lipid kinase
LAVLIRKALLIVNPASRRGQWLLEEALAAFRAASVPADFFQTEEIGHGGAIARELAPRYDATFTLGGDGTADEVIGALAGTGLPVGVLPGGTGNLLARTLGTPLSVRRAVPALLDGEAIRCDLGLINGDRYFVFSLGVGMDARMMAETSRVSKRIFGVAAYLLTGIRLVLFRRPVSVRVMVNGETLERDATVALVANFGSVLSDFMRFGPDISSDDGLLNLTVLSPRNSSDAVRVLWKLIVKDFSEDPCVDFRSATRVHLDAVGPSGPAVVQADGELLGTTPVDVEVIPLAATLLRRRRGRGWLHASGS